MKVQEVLMTVPASKTRSAAAAAKGNDPTAASKKSVAATAGISMRQSGGHGTPSSAALFSELMSAMDSRLDRAERQIDTLLERQAGKRF